MLLELQLENFKSWQTLNLKLGRVTGLFGTNSSGKSSILQFLLLLKQTKDATDRGLVLDLGGQNQLVNLGSYKDLIYRHQENLSLKWNIIFLDNILYIPFITSAEVVCHNKQMRNVMLEYKCDDSVKEILSRRKQNTEYFIEKFYIRELSSIYYLAPLREYPKREYQWSGASPSHVGYRGERTIEAILSATIRQETRLLPYTNEQKPFQEVIAYWLKQLGLIYYFAVKEIAKGTGLYRAIVKKTQESPKTFLTDVGFGVSQLLPALVLLYYVPEGSIILMEQPEIHLHPSVQSGLADVMLYVAKERNLQIIVESHSEHLLRRFQRRIAEEQYSVEELKLYFCHSENGASQLSDLKINQYGEIENWPTHFFGDEMAEISATRKAALKRKIQDASNND